jgi:hypothetical protein
MLAAGFGGGGESFRRRILFRPRRQARFLPNPQANARRHYAAEQYLVLHSSGR